MVVPSNVTLKFTDSSGNEQEFPVASIGGSDYPSFPAPVIYKDAAGAWQFSTLDVLLAAIRDRLPEAGVATQATLAALLADSQAKADLTETQPVSAASLPLPSGAATEATLAALAAEDFASQTTLAAVLTELQAKANLAETQPVSVASLPLPSGAATEATLAALAAEDFASQTTLAAVLAELQAKADLSETQPVSAASLPLPSGAATEATLAAVETAVDALEANTAPAAAYSVLTIDLGTARATPTAIIGASKTILWVKVVKHDGITEDAKVRLGTSANDAIPIPKLISPDSDVIFTGRIVGDVYVENTAQSGETLRLLVGTES